MIRKINILGHFLVGSSYTNKHTNTRSHKYMFLVFISRGEYSQYLIYCKPLVWPIKPESYGIYYILLYAICFSDEQ